MSRLKDANYFLFELWIFLRAMPFGLGTIALTMLVQDKICLHSYHQPAHYCQNISQEATASLVSQQTRDAILADSAKFTTYKNLLECIPMVLWSLFSGSFLDKYAGGTRLLFILGILGDFIAIGLTFANILFWSWNPYLVLLPSLTYWLTGGMASFFTVAYRYVVITSIQRIRPVKFMLFSFAAFMGMSLGGLIAGQILKPRPPTEQFPQLRTYHYNFLLSVAFLVISLALVFKLESADKQKPEPEAEECSNTRTSINCETDEEASLVRADSEISGLLDQNHNEVTNYETIRRLSSTDSVVSSPPNRLHFLRILFDLQNIRETAVCFLRPRPGHTSLQMYLIFSIIVLYILLFFGSQAIMFQFVEKVYSWDSRLYSNNSFIVNMIQTGFVTALMMFIGGRGKGKFNDDVLLVWALVSNFTQQLVVGTILTPVAYFVGNVLGSFGGFAPIVARNKMSRIIPSDEVGKIFSLLSTVEATMPFFGSVIYANLFALSIANYTGLIFQLSAALMVLAAGLAVFQELYCGKVPIRPVAS